MMERRSVSLYEVLRVKRDASPKEIKAAYRNLAKLYHPDAATQPEESADGRNFIEIHDAYATLSDPSARALYDLKLSVGSRRRGFARSVDGFRIYPTRRWETDQCWWYFLRPRTFRWRFSLVYILHTAFRCSFFCSACNWANWRKWKKEKENLLFWGTNTRFTNFLLNLFTCHYLIEISAKFVWISKILARWKFRRMIFEFPLKMKLQYKQRNNVQAQNLSKCFIIQKHQLYNLKVPFFFSFLLKVSTTWEFGQNDYR